MNELVEIVKTAGPVGATALLMAVVFLRYLRTSGQRLGHRLDAVTDEYITSLKTIIADNKDAMNHMIEEFRQRPCMMKLTHSDLKVLMDARQAENKAERIMKQGNE